MAYHDYEGLAVEEDEIQRLQDDLGDANFMLLRNHGALTMGLTIGDAFMHMYDLLKACEIQIKIDASSDTPSSWTKALLMGSKRKQALFILA